MARRLLSECDILPRQTFPAEPFRCTYCDSTEHSIQRCPAYDFHNDMGSEIGEDWSRGRDMVLARRKCNYFGGVPEMYLKKPTPEQAQIAERFRLQQAEKFMVEAKRISETLRIPKEQRDMERGFCFWNIGIWRLTGAAKWREKRAALEKQ